MGSRRYEHLERDALLARKDEQISTLDAHLHQTIARLSLVRARLLSTLDQLDALQQEHTAALAAAARDQRVLEARLRAAEEVAREGEADRMDMREAVGMLVKKELEICFVILLKPQFIISLLVLLPRQPAVEATPDFRNWPRSQIHLSSLAEPSLLSSPHPPHPSPSKSKSRRNQHPSTLPDHEGPPVPDNHDYNHNHTHHHRNHDHNYNHDRPNHTALTEQLAYACTLISHFRSARDAAVVRAERSEARVLELEAKVARREAEAEVGMEMIPGHMASPVPYRRKPKPKPHNGVRQADPDEIQEIDDINHITDILDVSAERNMELEREVKRLSRRLDHARAARYDRGGLRGATTPRPHHSQEHKQLIQHVPVTLRDRGPTPPLQQQQRYGGGDAHDDPNASLLSSLSFSPSSSASSGAAGSVTPRQYAPREHRDEYRYRRRAYHGNENEGLAVYEYDNDNDDLHDEGSFSTYEDEDPTEEADGDEDGDESVTQPLPVNDPNVKVATLSTANTDIHLKYHDSVMSDDTAIIKPVGIHVPVPALRALERQIALLGKKIDAFAAERRRVARGVVDAGGDLGRGPDMRAKVDVEMDADMDEDVVEGTRTDDDLESWDVTGTMGDRRQDTGVSNGGSRHARVVEQEQRDEESKVHYGGSSAVHSSTQESSVQEFKSTTPQPQPRPVRDDAGYDHPHGACEATLLAARKREMELVARVRVLEGALSVVEVEAQVRLRAETEADADAELREWEGNEGGDYVVERGGVSGGRATVAQDAVPQESETQACWVDAAVQTLKTPPQAPLITPAPVGDLLGLDVPELRVVEEERRKNTEGGQDGTSEKEDEEDGADEGEMPMELATPLLPVLSIPAPDTDDENDLGGPRNGHDEGPYELESEAGSSVEEDLGTRSEWDPPSAPADDIEFQIPQPATSVLDDGERRLPASEVELGGSPAAPTHPESSTADQGTPSPPMSTGTSPTIAVGLLPPLPPHAHLSLPFSLPLLHHSRHASSFSSPLLPLPNPHSGLRRADTEDVGADSYQTESAQRFVLYRATSSFVAELRQVESRLAEAAVQDEDRRTLERLEGPVAPDGPDAEAGAEKATE